MWSLGPGNLRLLVQVSITFVGEVDHLSWLYQLFVEHGLGCNDLAVVLRQLRVPCTHTHQSNHSHTHTRACFSFVIPFQFKLTVDMHKKIWNEFVLNISIRTTFVVNFFELFLVLRLAQNLPNRTLLLWWLLKWSKLGIAHTPFCI